jgi:hypothetical protein
MSLSIIFSAASLILCGFFFLYFRSYLKKNISSEGLLEEYQDEVNRLIADIDAATDRDAYLVEERIKSLKSLMAELDKKIGVYVQEFDRRRNSEAVYTALGRTAATRSPAVPPPPEQTAAVPPAASNEAAPPAATPEPAKTKSLREQITELSAQGLSPGLISTRLKVSLSEVDLVLAIQNTANTRTDIQE